MAYYNEDQLKRYFEEAIKEESEKRKEKLRKEIDYLYSKEMGKINAELDLKKKLELSKAMRELQIEYQDRINKIGVGYDEQLIKERKVMVNNVFEAVYKKLHAYRQTDAYLKKMAEKISAAKAYAKAMHLKFEIGTQDTTLQAFFKKENIVFTLNDDIHFGGFRALIEERNIAMDETLDSKLDERKKWFYENAKLFIKQ